MVLATWWYEDGQPTERRVDGMTVAAPVDDRALAAVAGLSPAEVLRRRRDGHRPYLAMVDGRPAAYGWVASRSAFIGELALRIDLPAGQRYLWDFATLPQHRGRGVYPALLAEIVRRECPPATRLWILHAPENLPSGLGIARAGFTSVCELSFDGSGAVALSPIGDASRAAEAAALLALPLRAAALDPCWACGGCACEPSGGGACGCATAPAGRA